MSELVRYETERQVAHVTICRPQKRNALSGAVVEQLKAHLQEAADDASVRVVVLTGEGSAFSAGADLAMLEGLQGASPMENLADSRSLAELFDLIYTHPKPVIAKVNGHAIGGGCGLVAACDIAIASDSAKFGFTEVRIGFVPAIVLGFAIRKMGEARARDLLLSGRIFTAAEGERFGLLTEVVPAETLEETVAERAEGIAHETSGSAVALTKKMFAQLPGMGAQEALEYGVSMNAFARGTDDCQAGIRAFLDRTDPPWKTLADS